jgi:peptidoglycan/xylan/chitin deacetylase (PgdA/CDA1 family)
MLYPQDMDFVEPSADALPSLFVVVDTEEEFDWSLPHARMNTSVASVASQHRAQEIFSRYGIIPVYVVDYAVAASEAAVAQLRRFLEDGSCHIGAHLHPWVNPPHDEPVNARNSYPGNLPPALERAKLEVLTQKIEEMFGTRPTVYRAGRYGVGPATADILDDLGYKVDLSIVPHTSFAEDGGPNFHGFAGRPYRFGVRRDLLELPLSCGFCGLLRGFGAALYPLLASPPGMTVRAPGIAARLGLLERIRLTPEGVDHAAHRRLTDALFAQGCRIFSMSYHSPSLEPGHTPYVRDKGDLKAFLDAIDRYLDYFFNELGGSATTPMDLYRSLVGKDSQGAIDVPRRKVSQGQRANQ